MEGWQRPLMKAARTMQQLRNLEPLGKGNPPHREYIAIPGCGRVDLAEGCPVENFAKLVDTLLRSSGEWLAPGHASVAPGLDGRPQLFFHAFHPETGGYNAFRALLTVGLNFEMDRVSLR